MTVTATIGADGTLGEVTNIHVAFLDITSASFQSGTVNKVTNSDCSVNLSIVAGSENVSINYIGTAVN